MAKLLQRNKWTIYCVALFTVVKFAYHQLLRDFVLRLSGDAVPQTLCPKDPLKPRDETLSQILDPPRIQYDTMKIFNVRKKDDRHPA